MEARMQFQKKARFLQNITLLVLVLWAGFYLYLFPALRFHLPPYGTDKVFDITYAENEQGYKSDLRISVQGAPYGASSGIIFRPNQSLPESGRQAMLGLSLAHLPLNALIFSGLWFSFLFFKTLSASDTPFSHRTYQPLKIVGLIIIIYALGANMFYRLIAAFMLQASPVLDNPISFITLLLGIVTLIFSEILEYGTLLQTTVDETL